MIGQGTYSLDSMQRTRAVPRPPHEQRVLPRCARGLDSIYPPVALQNEARRWSLSRETTVARPAASAFADRIFVHLACVLRFTRNTYPLRPPPHPSSPRQRRALFRARRHFRIHVIRRFSAPWDAMPLPLLLAATLPRIAAAAAGHDEHERVPAHAHRPRRPGTRGPAAAQRIGPAVTLPDLTPWVTRPAAARFDDMPPLIPADDDFGAWFRPARCTGHRRARGDGARRGSDGADCPRCCARGRRDSAVEATRPQCRARGRA
ncbi:hypothetical protein B0H17DRAFT_709197 [Mycena rosella]|uniref:Uncharacterized protein n=1 Tax=Mycena rosella TaxID=1033263 RepID=A0AAD7DAA3_MYCRO|nr:hypothetical protein B0H17DRAFT_709197 [Mycena rosella]